MDSTLSRLQKWYSSQCNGVWEHRFGVKIDTIDNPGWVIRIDLAGTNLEGCEFEAVFDDGLPEKNAPWHTLSVKGTTFEAVGDPSKLAFMLDVFLEWANRPGR